MFKPVTNPLGTISECVAPQPDTLGQCFAVVDPGTAVVAVVLQDQLPALLGKATQTVVQAREARLFF